MSPSKIFLKLCSLPPLPSSGEESLLQTFKKEIVFSIDHRSNGSNKAVKVSSILIIFNEIFFAFLPFHSPDIYVPIKVYEHAQ